MWLNSTIFKANHQPWCSIKVQRKLKHNILFLLSNFWLAKDIYRQKDKAQSIMSMVWKILLIEYGVNDSNVLLLHNEPKPKTTYLRCPNQEHVLYFFCLSLIIDLLIKHAIIDEREYYLEAFKRIIEICLIVLERVRPKRFSLRPSSLQHFQARSSK